MVRKIKYKPISQELAQIAKPSLSSSARTSVGLDKAVGEYYYIDLERLKPFKHQARKVFDHKEIESLAESIRQHGIRQPLSVVRQEDGNYEIVSGERRFKAAQLAKLEKVPCIILHGQENADAIALIENMHRKDLHPIEQGVAYQLLLKNKVFGSQEEIAQAISVTKSKISEGIKLATLPENIQFAAINAGISSRDKLRGIIKAYEEGDLDRVETMVGLKKRLQKNFSVLRVLCSQGKISLQRAGIAKLSAENKAELKISLLNLINDIDKI